MKRKILAAAGLTAITVLGVFSVKSTSNTWNKFKNNCEALTACEIFISYEEDGETHSVATLICEGEDGICQQSFEIGKLAAKVLGLPAGEMTLKCTGTQVFPEPEE